MTEFAPTAAANTGCELFMTPKFKSGKWQSINHEGLKQLKGQFEERSLEIQSNNSHTTNCRFEIGGHKDTHISYCNGC